MRKTMSRLTRACAVTGAGLLATGVAVAGAPAASATTCKHTPVHDFCGAANNKTGRTMHITTTLGSGTSGWCDVWNKDGGWNPKSWHASCDQEAWGNGTKGGNGTGVDVDAFTFNSEGYHERYSRVGEWRWLQKGVWTKIRDPEIAECVIGDSNEIWCTLLVQEG